MPGKAHTVGQGKLETNTIESQQALFSGSVAGADCFMLGDRGRGLRDEHLCYVRVRGFSFPRVWVNVRPLLGGVCYS